MGNRAGKAVTEVDRKVLASLPRGEWFNECRVWHTFKNREYRLRRLEEQGLVESKMIQVEGMGGPTRNYRVK